MGARTNRLVTNVGAAETLGAYLTQYLNGSGATALVNKAQCNLLRWRRCQGQGAGLKPQTCYRKHYESNLSDLARHPCSATFDVRTTGIVTLS
jgi:hypothetical protein